MNPRVRCVILAAVIGFAVAGFLPSSALASFSGGFEDCLPGSWQTWTAQGTTNHVVGPGFDMTAAGGGIAHSGNCGLRLHRPVRDPQFTSVIAEVDAGVQTGHLHFTAYIKPFIASSEVGHSQILVTVL